MKTLLTTTTVLCTLLFAPAANASGADDVDPDMVAKLAHKLQLTPKQRTNIRNLHDAVRKSTIKLRAEIEATGIDLRRELDQDNPNEGKVGRYIAKISQLEGKARQARVVSWIRIRKQLNPSQRKMLGLFKAGKDHYAATKHKMKHKMKHHLHREMAELKRARARMRKEMHRLRREARREASRARRIERVERRKMREFKRRMKHLKKRKHRHDSHLRNPFDSSRKGTVMINSNPHARIYVNGKLIGTTPIRAKLKAGVHKIKAVSAKGTRTRTLHVQGGHVTSLAISF